jgi:hypothetical protein
MKKIFAFAILGLLASPFTVLAQEESGLTNTQILRSVRAIYDQGRLHEIPVILEPILSEKASSDKDSKKGTAKFTKTEKVEALQILILTYIYLEEPAKADEKMIQLLTSDHSFEITGAEPIEFQKLYEKFRIDPIFRVGLKAGLNQTYINTIKNHFIQAESQGKGKYVPTASFQIGGAYERNLSTSFVIAPELFMTTQTFSYKNDSGYIVDKNTANEKKPAGSSQKIVQKKIQLNAVFQFIIPPRKKYNNISNRPFTPYLIGGPVVSYLSGSTFSGSTVIESKDNITGDKFDNKDRYHTFNLAAMLGGGVRYNLGAISVSIDARYQYDFFNAVNGKNRYNETSPAITKIIHQYGYVDNDFSLRSIVANVGIIVPVFVPKKLIK